MIFSNILSYPDLRKKDFPLWDALISKASERVFTSTDIGEILQITNRKLIYWDEEGVFKLIRIHPRAKTTKWKKFCVLDLFPLALIRESMNLGTSIDQLKSFIPIIDKSLFEVVPNIVCGFDVFIISDFRERIEFIELEKGEEFDVRKLRDGRLLVILWLNQLVDDIFQRMDIHDFRVFKKERGGYGFVANGIPLTLEPIPKQLEMPDLFQATEEKFKKGGTE